MRNFIIVLLVVLIGLAFWPDPRDEEKKEAGLLAAATEVETSTTLVTTSTLFPTTTTVFVHPTQTTPAREHYEDLTTTTLTTTTQQLNRRQQRSQKAFELAQAKLKEPIKKELARAVSFKVWPRDEVKMTGSFQGKVQLDGKEHVLRLNLLFNPDTGAVTPNTCAAFFSREKVLFRESFRGKKMRFSNPPEKGYFIVSISRENHLELFRIGSGGASVYQANLFLPNKQPIAMQLDVLTDASTQDRCLQVY